MSYAWLSLVPAPSLTQPFLAVRVTLAARLKLCLLTPISPEGQLYDSYFLPALGERLEEVTRPGSHSWEMTELWHQPRSLAPDPVLCPNPRGD